MTAVQVLVTDFGTYPMPAELGALLAKCKFRKDLQPDRRTKAGKEWSVAFGDFTEQKRQEYFSA
jgi:hypothetical protein